MKLFMAYVLLLQILRSGSLVILGYQSGFGLTCKLVMTLKLKKTAFKTGLIKKCIFTQWQHKNQNFCTQKRPNTAYPVTHKAHWGELYFATDELEPISQRLNAAGVEFIHPICEQPWGQRVMRFSDPDGHMIEIDETLEAVVWRFDKQGFSIERIREKSGLPREFIEGVLQAHTQTSGG
jgi:uncharacterized glyoxalase superfamily protein PhnB